jgi:hypothetical protein
MLKIDSFQLRVGGMSAEQAGRLGESVARLLAARLPQRTAPLSLGELAVRIAAQPSLPPERLAEQIAEAILERLK